eukprot:3541652-Pleurochrysis_carterae.AAC.1
MRPSVSPGWCTEARASGATVVTCVRAGLRFACSFALYVVKCDAMETAATDAHAVWRATRNVQVNAPADELMTGAMNVDASDDRHGSSCAAKRQVRGTHVHTEEATRRRRFRPTVKRALSKWLTALTCRRGAFTYRNSEKSGPFNVAGKVARCALVPAHAGRRRRFARRRTLDASCCRQALALATATSTAAVTSLLDVREAS